MKKLIFMTFLLGLNAGALAKDIRCDFVDTTFVNQFQLELRDINTEEPTFENVEFDFTLRVRGRDPKIERYVVTRSGTVQTFAAGTMYKHEAMRMYSVMKGEELEYINILIDAPPFYTSQIRFLDGMTYFGSCRSI